MRKLGSHPEPEVSTAASFLGRSESSYHRVCSHWFPSASLDLYLYGR